MKTLIAFEFKKLTGKKSIWIVLALGLAAFALLNLQSIVTNDLFAQAQGMKDVYSQYEGQEVTDAFQKQAQEDFNAYMASHAGRFLASTVTDNNGREYTWYFADQPGYYEGVRRAFEELSNTYTLEYKQKLLLQARERVDAGAEENGQPLTDTARSQYEAVARNGVTASVVRYSELWTRYLANDNAVPGILALLIMAMALLGLFNGEVTSRLEPVVLTAKARNQVLWAKLLVMVLVAAGSAALLYGLQFALDATIWGTSGSELPVSSFFGVFFSNYNGGIPIGAAFAWGQLVVLLSALCCGAVLAWASARWRRPMSVLLAAGLVLGGMIGLDSAYRNYAYIIGVFSNSFLDNVGYVLTNFPARVLFSGYPPFQVINTTSLAVELALLPALTVLLVFLTRRTFLHRQKI